MNTAVNTAVNTIVNTIVSTMLRYALILFFAMGSLSAQASDLAKEKRWAGQIVDALVDGDAVWLKAGKIEFLGIYTPAQDDSSRAVIVLHGLGVHPDWQQVVLPLRVGLTEHGWNTLSIQLPILGNEVDIKNYEPLYDEVPPRIAAAIAYLGGKGIKDIVLVAHSLGAMMSAYSLSKHPDGVRGLAAIGMQGSLGSGNMNTLEALKHIRLPILDLYGSADMEDVLKTKNERSAAAKTAGNKHYTQTSIAGANHFFDEHETELVDTVASWLDSLPK